MGSDYSKKKYKKWFIMINKEKFRKNCIQRLKEFNRPNVYLLDKKVCNWLYFYMGKE